MNDIPEELQTAIEHWLNDTLGMTSDDVFTAFATLNGAPTINEVDPRTLLYWSAFFIELARLTHIVQTGMHQLLTHQK